MIIPIANACVFQKTLVPPAKIVLSVRYIAGNTPNRNGDEHVCRNPTKIDFNARKTVGETNIL